MITSDREEILSDEFTRVTPGLRPFSVGLLKICRKLGLALASPPGQRQLTEEEGQREIAIVAWLLDERHDLEQIKLAPQMPPERFSILIDKYEFEMEPAFLLAVQREVARASAAVQQSFFRVVPKPGAKAGPSPPGNS
jgi:hypothetical protein